MPASALNNAHKVGTIYFLFFFINLTFKLNGGLSRMSKEIFTMKDKINKKKTSTSRPLQRRVRTGQVSKNLTASFLSSVTVDGNEIIIKFSDDIYPHLDSQLKGIILGVEHYIRKRAKETYRQ